MCRIDYFLLINDYKIQNRHHNIEIGAQSINLEIIGSQDYTNFGQAEITKIEDNKVSGVVNGQFYNPYRDELQIALLVFDNIEIGMDPEGTFYDDE